MNPDSFFRSRPVFTYQEFADFLEDQGSRNVRTRWALLAYHARKGRIVRVRRGLYASVPPGQNTESIHPDPYLLASKMAPDAVLGYHAALQLQGRAYSIHNEFTYLTRSSARSTESRGLRFRGVRPPKALTDGNQEFFGVRTVDRAGLDVRVTNFERTLVDVLDRPALGGGWEEIWKSLESVEYFDLGQVVDYALLLGNSTVVAKVGFFLEEHRDKLRLQESQLEPLLAHRPRSPHYMVRREREPGRYVSRWNLVVPEAIANRTWEEVL